MYQKPCYEIWNMHLAPDVCIITVVVAVVIVSRRINEM